MDRVRARRSPSRSACCSATRVRITTLAVLGAAADARRRCRRCRPRPGASSRRRRAGVRRRRGPAGADRAPTRRARSDHPPLTVVSQGVSRHGSSRSTASIRRSTTRSVIGADRQRRPRSARACSSQPQDTSDPARAWTTIATGQPPDVHGVHGDRDATASRASRAPSRAGSGTLAPRDPRRDRRRAADAAVGREPRRAAGEDDLGGRRGGGPADRGRELVGDMARASATAASSITDRAVLRLEHGGALDAEIAPADPVPGRCAGVAGDPQARARRGRRGVRRRRRSGDAAGPAPIRRARRARSLGLAQALPGPRARSRRRLSSRARHRAARAARRAGGRAQRRPPSRRASMRCAAITPSSLRALGPLLGAGREADRDGRDAARARAERRRSGIARRRHQAPGRRRDSRPRADVRRASWTSRRRCSTRSACRSAASSRAQPLPTLFGGPTAAIARTVRGDLRPPVHVAGRARGQAARSGDDRSAPQSGVCEVQCRVAASERLELRLSCDVSAETARPPAAPWRRARP